MQAWMDALMAWMALPKHGLGTVFVVSLLSATLLPVGSEPAVFGLIKLNPELFWPAVLVATAGIAHTARTADIYKAARFSDHAPLTIQYEWGL